MGQSGKGERESAGSAFIDRHHFQRATYPLSPSSSTLRGLGAKSLAWPSLAPQHVDSFAILEKHHFSNDNSYSRDDNISGGPRMMSHRHQVQALSSFKSRARIKEPRLNRCDFQRRTCGKRSKHYGAIV